MRVWFFKSKFKFFLFILDNSNPISSNDSSNRNFKKLKENDE